MKKKLLTAVLVLALAVGLSACGPGTAEGTPTPTAVPTQTMEPPQTVEPTQTPIQTPTPTPEPMPTPKPAIVITPTPEPTPGPLDISQEPPLDEFSLSVPVPDFLTEEQQVLYRRASNVYLNLFGGDTSNCDSWPLADGQAPADRQARDMDGWTYTPCLGRYQNWADFEALVAEIFTDRFFAEKNGAEDEMLFRELDGGLYYLNAARGTGEYRNDYFPDTFELIEQTEQCIRFYVVGYYSYTYPRHDEPYGGPEVGYPNRDARLAAGYEYEERYEIGMVQTEKGWRFDSFYNTWTDAGDYKGALEY